MQQASQAAAPVPDGLGLRVGVIVSRFNEAVTARLREGAREALRLARVADHAIEWYDVPGAFELPLAAKSLARSGRVDGIVCLGCVIRGETPHFQYVSSAAASGLAQATLETGVPMAFGVLTTDTQAQADARSGPGPANKGFEAVCAVLDTVRVLERVRSAAPGAPRS